ncbi:MAG: hypothetical protein ACI3T2_04265 [Anaerovibrio sp.]
MQEAMWSYVEFYPIFYLKVMKVVVIRNFVIAKKKVNDNIISVRMQNIRLRGEIIAVNRRTGG